MRLRIIEVPRNNTVYRYAQIVEKKIENGKPRIRILKHLGPVRNDKDVETYRKLFLLEEEKNRLDTVSLNSLTMGTPMDFGMIYASRVIISDLGIADILERTFGRDWHLVFLMIVSRFMNASSDLSFLEYAGTVYYPWADLNLRRDRIYRLLDRLEKNKEDVELDLFNMLKPDVSMVHYDLTSSYFEGKENNDLVLFGYSRDRKRGKEQIVIGLVMADGIPIYHEVWPGNTIDPKTLEKTVSVLKERFHIKNVIIIADRAFGRYASLKLLDQNRYITAVYRWDRPYRNILMDMHFEEKDKDRSGDLFIRTVSVDVDDITHDGATDDEKDLIMKRRYIAVYNPEREKEDLDDLNGKIETVRKKISEISDQADLKKSLGKLRSLVKFSDHGVEMNEKRIIALKGLAGRFMIVTNTDLPVEDVVKSYKDQWQIERSFRTIKSFLEIRPVYHRKDERINAHVFVCVLSLLLSRLIEKRAGGSTTIYRISEALSQMKAVPLSTNHGKIIFRTESESSRDILTTLAIPYPERIIGQILTK